MAAAEQLRDLSQLIDVGVLDTTVAAVYVSGSKEEIAAADPILRDLEADPDMWRQVPHILKNTNMTSTKFFALQLLEVLIKNRWYALSVEDREHLLTYIINAVKQLWSNEASFGSERVYVNKLYVILVQIVKHEWPLQLTSFITSLVGAAKARESICKEAVAILKLLSEEVVDISRGEMTPRKRAELKRFLGSEYKHIHEFFIGLLSTSQNLDLIHSTLSARFRGVISPLETLKSDEAALDKLNGLCSAIGSLSGFMAENQENAFLVTVFTHLWELCRKNQGSNKAGVATNMMYVFGQYPWFFRARWNDLKDGVMKMLLKYMLDTDPAVQDMACDTFSKIVQGCKPELVIVQAGEEEPFVSELLSGLATIIQALKPYQLNSFYESVGNMIQAESDPQKRDQYLQRLMAPPNQKWGEIIGQARQSVESLKDLGVLHIVLNILQANNSAATSLGTYFFSQFSFIYEDMLFLYKMYSDFVSTIISGGGPDASKTSFVKRLRSVKREILKLIETFLDKAEEDQPRRGKQFVPLMMGCVLADYPRNVPDARESEVLSLFATIINKYKASMLDDVENIFTAVFLSTLEMINKNFEDYPEHRFKFFSLLRAIATFCFSALTKLSSQELKLVMDSIIWAFQHTERDIAEIGLNILLEMLKKFQQSAFCNQFFRSYFTTIEQEIFAVLTDTFHKPGFKLHVLVLHHLFHLVESDALTEPLWDAPTVSYTDNAAFVREHTISLLSSSVPIVEVTPFVAKLFTFSNDLSGYQNIICDFLRSDIKDLDAEEQKQEQDRQRILSNPGLMIANNEIQDAMVIGQCRI